MKKSLLTLLLTLATAISASAVDFQWGTATWNITDGRVYEDIDDLNLEGIVLTYPNPANYTLTFFQMLAVSYDLYIDDATEPIKASASARQSTAISFNYQWSEGHNYKIVTTGAVLAQANLATYSTDTISSNSDSYTISFTIKGPELVKTIEVEGTMSLSIIDQEWQKTYSLLNTREICEALGIESLDTAVVDEDSQLADVAIYRSDRLAWESLAETCIATGAVHRERALSYVVAHHHLLAKRIAESDFRGTLHIDYYLAGIRQTLDSLAAQGIHLTRGSDTTVCLTLKLVEVEIARQ